MLETLMYMKMSHIGGLRLSILDCNLPEMAPITIHEQFQMKCHRWFPYELILADFKQKHLRSYLTDGVLSS